MSAPANCGGLLPAQAGPSRLVDKPSSYSADAPPLTGEETSVADITAPSLAPQTLPRKLAPEPSAKSIPSNTSRCVAHRSQTEGENNRGKLQPNILIPWKKRPLKTGSTNFHSIADLVKPSSKRENIPACVTSRMLPIPTRPPPPGSMTSTQYLEESMSSKIADDQQRNTKIKREICDASVSIRNRGLEGDTDVAAHVCSTGEDACGIRSTPSTSSNHLNLSAKDPHHLASNTTTTPSSPPVSSLSQESTTQEPSSSISPPASTITDAETADPNRLRKGRTIYKAQQVYVLEQVFSRTHYPDPEVIETLSRELDISENKIKVWFQNKRARWRRRAAETGLPPQPIGFTLSGTPGLPSSWPHPTSLPSGVLMPQPVYSSHYGGQQVSPRHAFQHVGHLTGLSTSPLYLGFDSSIMHPTAKGLSAPALLPYTGYHMASLPTPTHVWGDSPKLPGT